MFTLTIVGTTFRPIANTIMAFLPEILTILNTIGCILLSIYTAILA
jgi:hypothetical protein